MKKTLVWTLTFAFVCTVAVATGPAAAGTAANMSLAAPALAPQAFSERAPGLVERDALIAEQAALSSRLMGDQVVAGLTNPIRVELTEQERQLVFNGPAELRLRVGVMKEVRAGVELGAASPSGLALRSAQRLSVGAVSALGEGGFVWTGAVEAPGAAALRVHLTDVFLPRNAQLFVYNQEGQAHGPYSGSDVWTHAVRGSQLLIQVRYTGTDTARALAATRLTISEVGYLTEKFLAAVLAQRPSGGEAPQLGERAFCSFNASCVENAACSSVPANVAPAEDAVALILYSSRGSLFICSGGLLADTDSGSQIPYFLTANHCLSKGREASSVQAFFQFTTPCGGSCPDPRLAGVPTTNGSSIVASNRTSDYTLLQLDEPAPAGSVFLGWDSAPVAFNQGDSLYRISHPAGAPQAYSEHSVDVNRTTCSSWPRGGWIYSVDQYGATEGGSSGSPVLNASGQVVGQLSGACGFNVNDSCDSAANSTVDGAFANYYADVAQYLDPGTGGCTDADGDGWCVEDGDCDDGNAAVNPGQAEICDDLLDNDCDGLIDGNDSDCDAGGCDLLPSGASCTDNSECCSGNCKGKPGSRTCK